MTLGVSLALTLGAGLYVAPGDEEQPAPIAVRVRHRLAYAARLDCGLRLPYGDLAITRARLPLPYGDLAVTRAACALPYWLTEPVTSSHKLAYAVTDVDPLYKRLTAAWSLLDGVRLQAVAGNPELAWAGQKIGIVQATLSCDEGSPVWLANVEVASLAEFAQIAMGDALTLTLGLETFAFVVDGKTLSREGIDSQRCELSAVSPLALLDAPFAGTTRLYEPAAIAAASAVERLIGPVDWQLPAWVIPAGRLLLENVTPLAAARNIVAAIGGLIESNPDGSVVCRRRHPVSIPQYATTAPAASLFDADVLTVSAQIAPQRGFNRVTVANEDGAGSDGSDRIDYVADDDDRHRGTVRVYLARERPVALVHTGHAGTVIASAGAVTRTETEILEFIEGRASTRYPVSALVSRVWQHANLGSVAADGQTLIAATPGYSLLNVSYATTALEWRVALFVDEEVQFVLVDA